MKRGACLAVATVWGLLGCTKPGAGGKASADSGAMPGTTGSQSNPSTGPSSPLPTAQDWQFYGTQNGGPQQVMGVTSDQGGNIWVAGGEEGLFLLRPGASNFERFTMADGLHPYGFLPDGSVPSRTYLNAISVSGGPTGTVFVGYMGMPPDAGEIGCEDNWDGPNPDPSIYKSGDADRVMLGESGLQVVHYDIFSGPGVVAAEPAGREKLCSILRILYDQRSHSVWFGGNHGFAWGDPDYAGNPTCNGQLGCAGLFEHAHPALNAWADDAMTSIVFLTDSYYGLAVDASGDLWGGRRQPVHPLPLYDRWRRLLRRRGRDRTDAEPHRRVARCGHRAEHTDPRPADRR